MGCLDEERVFGLVSGTLATSEVESARAHLGDCAACRVLVAETAKSMGVSEGGVADLPETLPDAPSWRGKASAGELLPGDIVDGKYRIEGRIGRGGMGTVLAAVHLQLRVGVAIKVLNTTMLERRDVVGRFMREARAAAAIKSRHVVAVLDVGGLPTGEPYIVMERLLGNDLSQELASRGRIPLSEAIDYTLEICEAVAHAHATGVVHRDLKPANIFLCKTDGQPTHVKVLDFGISKTSRATGASSHDFSTEVQAWLGTPRYMAPEQITLGRRIDARADIWAIGTILYELVAGRAPFVDKKLEMLSKRILEDRVPSLSSVSGERLPPGFEAAVLRCLAKSVDARYQSVGALARALAPYASTSKTEALDRIAALAGMAFDPSERSDAGIGTKPRERRRFFIAMGVFLSAAIGALFAWRVALGVGKTPARSAPAMSSSDALSIPTPDAALASVSPAADPHLAGGDVPLPLMKAVDASSNSSSGSAHRVNRPPVVIPKPKHPEFGGRL